MKALVCERPGLLELREVDRPAAVPAGWVLLDMAYVGICGTDYHIYEGKHPFLDYPRIIGHELSATVADANGAPGLVAGDAVVINPYLACGRCNACRQGKPNCCEAIEVLGVHRDGGMSEQLAVPASSLIPAQGLSLRDAAMVEFLAIGAHAVRRSLRKDGNALAVGAGPIGLGTALFAQIAGLSVTIGDISAERLEQARSILGDVPTILLGSPADDEVVRASIPSGFDVVFDATGNGRSIMNGFGYVAHGGTYVLVSVVKDDITFSDPEFHKREMSLIGSRNATAEDFTHVITSMAAGKIPVDRLATHESSLEDIAADLPKWAHDKKGLVKALVRI